MSAIKLNSASGSVSIVPEDSVGEVSLVAPSVDDTIMVRGDSAVNVKHFGAVGDGVTDDTVAIQAAISYVGITGGTVEFPDGNDTYIFSADISPIEISSNTVINLGGNTLTRLDSVSRAGIRNINFGDTIDVNISIINGRLTGSGADNNTTDQGSAITFYGVTGFLIRDIETDATTGDGIGLRNADGTVQNVNIGNYGRNGISPTSGDITFNNVYISGVPFIGANPGIAIDAENNSATESSRMVWNNVRASNATLVDFYASSGEDYSHELWMTNCEIGPWFQALRILSKNGETIAKNIHIGPTNSLTTYSDNGSCIQLEDISGVNISSASLNVIGTVSGTSAVQIVGIVDNLKLVSPSISSDITNSILCFDTARLNNSIIDGISSGRLYLGGSDNVISNLTTSLMLNGADSTGNIIKNSSVNNISLINGALVSEAHFGGIDGIKSKSFFSASDDVPAGSTYDLVLPLPDATGATNGRLVTIIANYSHVGSITHWANLITTIAYGDTAQSEQTIINSSNGGSGAITVLSVGLDSCVLRLNYSFSGVFSAAVIG